MFSFLGFMFVTRFSPFNNITSVFELLIALSIYIYIYFFLIYITCIVSFLIAVLFDTDLLVVAHRYSINRFLVSFGFGLRHLVGLIDSCI